MNQKGLEANVSLKETPNFTDAADKPLKSVKIRPSKVDINVLKARAQKVEDKENRKNIIIFFVFLLFLAAIGTYLSV